MAMQYTPSKKFDSIIVILSDNINKIRITEATSLSNTGWYYDNNQLFDFEISFFTSGSTKMRCGDIEANVKAGEVFFFDCNEHIECLDGKFTFLTVVFNLDSDNNSNLYREIKTSVSGIIGRHVASNTKALESLYKNLISEYLHKNPHYEVNIKLLLIQILIEISKPKNISGGNPSLNNSKYSNLAWDIANHISENLEMKISLEDLSKKYKLNPRYMNRIFKSVTGLPIIQYRQQLRVDKAKKMLKTGSNSILDISTELDFPTSQYFSYIFKKLTGQTPSEYRK